MQNWMTPSRWVCITVHLLPQRSVFCGICLYSVMVTCECSHWFHTLQCFRLSEFIPKNNRKHQRFAQKALIRFFLCVVAQWNWALVFVVAIISLPCSLFFSFLHSMSSSDLMWKLCTEVFLSPFFSPRGPATQEKLFMGFIRCVYQRLTEKPHKLLPNGNITVYGMCGNNNNVSGKQRHISPCVILFSSPVLQGKPVWLHAAVSLSITQHLKGNFWFC